MTRKETRRGTVELKDLDLNALANCLVGRRGDVSSSEKASTFPLRYIFNKAEHAGNRSPLNYHLSFPNGPLLPPHSPFDFAHSSRIIGNIRCNPGQLSDLHAALPLCCVLGEGLRAWTSSVTCFDALGKRLVSEKDFLKRR